MTMKSFVALTFLFGFLFALSNASSVKTQESQALWKCEAKVFIELAEEAVSDVFDLYESLGTSYEALVNDALECAANYSDETDIVSCVADTLSTFVQDFIGAWETLYLNIIALAEELTNDIISCKK